MLRKRMKGTPEGGSEAGRAKTDLEPQEADREPSILTVGPGHLTNRVPNAGSDIDGGISARIALRKIDPC